ncbi:MAG: hypothetical protein HYW62_04235 [Candidatus Levybacteria bacterium]|nr:hypothetical protein [Candidatus Levybacteria bacterium]
MKYLTLSIPGFSNIDSEKINLTPVPLLPKGVPTGGLSGTGTDAIRVFIELTLVIAILVALYFIAKGGLEMIMSEGQKEKLQIGRKRTMYAILGLIVIFLSFTAINMIGAFFGYDFLCLLLQPASDCL